MELGCADPGEAQPLIPAPGAVGFQDLQAQRLMGGGGFAKNALEQRRADPGIAVWGQQRNTHHAHFRRAAMHHQPSGLHPVHQDDLGFRIGEGLTIPLARPELLMEEGLAEDRRPSPRLQFVLPGAGIEFKQEGRIGWLLLADTNGIHGGSPRSPGSPPSGSAQQVF